MVRMIPERPVTLAPAPGVRLEALSTIPPGARTGVVLCHPHPLYGGDMHNPVVLRAASACAAAGLGTLRFNFRGVGRSTGSHDDGRGERDDVRSAMTALGTLLGPDAAVALLGYSFGAVVAAASAPPSAAGLALVAPPLAFSVLDRLPAVAGPLMVVVGDADDYCPAAALERLRATWPRADVRLLAATDHFFAGNSLDRLGAALAEWATAVAGAVR